MKIKSCFFHSAMEGEVDERQSHYRLMLSSCPSLFSFFHQCFFLSIFQTFSPLSPKCFTLDASGEPGDLFYSCNIPLTVWPLMTPKTSSFTTATLYGLGLFPGSPHSAPIVLLTSLGKNSNGKIVVAAYANTHTFFILSSPFLHLLSLSLVNRNL